MEAITTHASPVRPPLAVTLWTRRVLGTLVVLFLLFDAVAKLLRLQPVIDGTVRVGYPEGVIVPLGIVLLISTVLYVVPRTAFIGAILLTAWLGGATATHVRISEPFWMPVLLGVIVWGCLAMRDERVRALVSRPTSER